MFWTIAFWLLLALGVGLIARGLFWDRPGFRGRPSRRCLGCGYDLEGAGAVPVTCAECGRVHTSEHSLRRVRRHKRVAAAGVAVLLAAPVVGLTPAYRRGTLFEPLPSWALIELQPLFSEEWWNRNNHPTKALVNRFVDTANPLSHEQLVTIINHVADGGVLAEAGSPRWGRTTGAWIGGQAFRFRAPGGGWQYPDGTPADGALQEAFERLTGVLPLWDPRTRERWPRGYRVTIESGSRHPRWPVRGDLNERAMLRLKGFDEITVDGFIDHFEIDPIGQAGDVIEGEIELSYFRVEARDRSDTDKPVKTRVFPIRWTVASGIDKVLATTDNAAIQAAMISLVAPGIARTLDDPGFLDDWLASEFDGIAFAIEAEVFDGEESLGKSEHLWMALDGQWVTRTTSVKGTSMAAYNVFGTRSKQARDKGTLRVVIRGVPGEALQINEAAVAWDGEVDVLYSDALKAADARASERTASETD